MDAEGPPLELLMHRLAETPEDFLAAPYLGGAPGVHVAAVARDLLASFGAAINPAELRELRGDREPPLRVALLMCWLLADPWFAEHRPPIRGLLGLLKDDAKQLAGETAPAKFVSDPERREELARLSLSRLGWRPSGETIAQAQDRLTSLSAGERARVMKAAKVAEERARAIREALARKAAEESADKWTRE